ncbi:MAG: hypothetical protein ACFB4I_11805 [Cyanophyceae cyanobacterium]
MKLKLAALAVGFLTLVAAAPLAAQGCEGGNRENNPETNLPGQTQTSVTAEGTTFA